MTTATIKAPRTASVTGTVGGTCIVGSNEHIDIGSPENGSFRLYGSGIGSFYVEIGTLCCGCSTDASRSVKITLYSQANFEGTVLGYVLFGHVKNVQISAGGHNYGPGGDLIGYTPAYCSVDPDNCYSLAHLHTEAEPYGVVSLTRNASYPDALTANSTIIYTWTY